MRYYDQNALKRIPLFAVVNLNLGFYYETGGMGYELLNILPSEANLISAELCNELTDSRLILKIPTSGAPLHKINRLITTELMSSSAKESQVKHLSMAELIARIQECLKVLD